MTSAGETSGAEEPATGARCATVALGSNLNAEANLRSAVGWLASRFTLLSLSRVYRTPPWGGVVQPDFLNAVAQVRTGMPPELLLDALLARELAQQRVRTVANGPRTLDLDLLLFEDRVLTTPRLTLPHPRLHERAFVLVPLCDVAPDLRHPVLGRSMADLLSGVDQAGIVRTDVDLRAG